MDFCGLFATSDALFKEYRHILQICCYFVEMFCKILALNFPNILAPSVIRLLHPANEELNAQGVKNGIMPAV